jgi:S-adenosylmethionine:tRNA ribosyltransferase-isomerase
VRTADLDYELPPEAIAQQPLDRRDSARLLVDRGPDDAPVHRRVSDLPSLLDDGDLLVVNTTRVLPGRLRLRRASGGSAEVLLVRAAGDGAWEALVRPSRRIRVGERLVPARTAAPDGPAASLEVEVGEDLGRGRRVVRLEGVSDEPAALDAVGEIPLPPYVHEALADPERYQTVMADRAASAAAPTAGLHLTEDLLDRCRRAGVEIAEVELEVGIATFRPIEAEHVEDHVMHAERYRVPAETVSAIRGARRVVAIGTTVVRTLESAARTGALVGDSELFIHGDFSFRVVDRLLTNFHLPRSSLLALVQAFAGPRWSDLYALALSEGYRFLSFGDAMLLDPLVPTRRDLSCLEVDR